MAEMSVIWLRVAAAFYSLGLLHAILTLVRRREHLFRVALTGFTLGTVFHFVSIVEEGIVNHRCPIANFYETLSMCAFLVAVVYLGVQLRYHVESLEQPHRAYNLAHRAYRAGAAGVCGPAVYRRGLPAPPLPGA